MCFNHKCNWCGNRKFDTFKITMWCKWYGFYICEECYKKKQRGLINGPRYK